MKIHYKTDRRKSRRERGSAILIVVVLCSFVLILMGTYLATLSTQSKINYRASLLNEARNASEGVAEFALAEMNRRSDSLPSFGAGTNPNPLSGYSLATGDISFIAPGTSNNHVVASSVAFKNSALSNAPSAPMLIDPNDPVFAVDADVGQTESVRSMNIFGKASVRSPSTNSLITSYVAENVQVREQSWFNYAIFYNMDMEFHAGPNFTVLGPVHTNASVYATEGDGNMLQFFASLTATEKIFRYDKYTGNTSGGHGGTVQCISKAGMNASDLVTMLTSADSRNSNFKTVATTNWKSFVQDQTFNVKPFNPPGLPAYVPENFSTLGTELRNNAYLMIEPQLSSLVTDKDNGSTTVTDYGQKTLVSENLKFSALSGFVIQVYPPTSIGAQPKWKLVLYQATDPSNPLSSNNPPYRDTATGKPVPAVTIDPFNDFDDGMPGYTTAGATMQHQLKVDLLNAIISVPYKDQHTTATSWGDGFSALVSSPTGAPGTATSYPIYDRREGYNYPGSASSTTNGLKGAMNVLRIDFGKLNTLLNTSSEWLKPYGSTAYLYQPSASYTGVIYVQFPLAPIDLTRFPTSVFGGTTDDGDQIRVAQGSTTTTPGYAVLVSNAGTLPQLSGGGPDGFTIATNGPLYVWGNFNADGLSSTGSSTTPDNANEVPALIAADSLTILSAKSSFDFAGMATGTGSAASFTEISAAVVAGLVPTQPGYNHVWSGGVHNLVRFLEDWSSSTYRYRGSIAVLYQSEVAKAAYHEGYNGFFYGAPTRAMGYHQYLSQGRFPPGTPIKRTVRRMNLQDITAATYNTGPQIPTPSN